MTLDALLRNVKRELAFARSKFPPFNNEHEAWAVIFEEVDELWDEVRRHREARSKQHMKKECIQIAAMALRFIEDCLEPDD